MVELLNSALSAKEMHVYLLLKTMLLWPVLGAHIIIGAYLTSERALDSFSKLLILSAADNFVLHVFLCNKIQTQSAFLCLAEMWRGIRGKQENSHE